MCEIVEREIIPYCSQWEEARTPPPDIWKKMAEWGILGGLLGIYAWDKKDYNVQFIGVPWRTEYSGSNIPGGIKPKEYDYFHAFILCCYFLFI